MDETISLLSKPVAQMPLLSHYAVRVGEGIARREFAEHEAVIVELTPSGVHRYSAARTSGWRVTEVSSEPTAAIRRLRQSLAAPPTYRLSDSNCEHFARYVVNGHPQSMQSSLVGLVALFAVLSVASTAVKS